MTGWSVHRAAHEALMTGLGVQPTGILETAFTTFSKLYAASTRTVLAAGAESESEMTHRAALAIAEQLGTEAVIFPSHHGGFLGGEFGMTDDPDAFGVTLRRTLAEEH